MFQPGTPSSAREHARGKKATESDSRNGVIHGGSDRISNGRINLNLNGIAHRHFPYGRLMYNQAPRVSTLSMYGVSTKRKPNARKKLMSSGLRR